MIFKSLHKSRTFTIIKSLATSPAANVFCNVVGFIIIILMIYGLYLFNLYLVGNKIVVIPRSDEKIISNKENAILLICIESLILIFIGLLSIFIWNCLSEISRCIYDTKQKLNEDLKQYECNSVVWQK